MHIPTENAMPDLNASSAPAVQSIMMRWSARSTPSPAHAFASSMPLNDRRHPSTQWGKFSHSLDSALPKSNPSVTFITPKKIIANEERAPNRYCPDRPPAPWQDGTAPNQSSPKFNAPTEHATRRSLQLRPGKRSFESNERATTEFSNVSGNCGKPPSNEPFANSCHVGLLALRERPR